VVAATIAVVASAHAASEADRAMMRAYADTMTNAIPTLLQGEEEMEKDCSSTSGPSGVSSCIHGLDFGGAGVRTVRRRLLARRRCQVADLLRDGYAKAQKDLVAWMPVGEVMPVRDMEVIVFRDARYRNRE
jgi:hypothetical protein